MHESISGFSILFHGLMCLILCHYYDVLIIITLCFEIKEYDISSFVLFAKLFWLLSVLWFHTNFKTFYSISWKWHWNFHRNSIDSIDCLGYYGYFHNINSSNPQIYFSKYLYISPFICVFFNFFQHCFIIFGKRIFYLLG
jgi:hypothetical protein